MHDMEDVSVRNVNPNLHMVEEEVNQSMNNNEIHMEEGYEHIHTE